MEDQALSLAIELCKKWEGLHKLRSDGLVYPYICPAGVWTIGYGSTRHFDGSRITKDTPPLSPSDCERLLLRDLRMRSLELMRLSPMLPLWPNSFGAILSFTYNLGLGAYKASTLRRRVNAEDWEAAQHEIKKWVWAGGKRLNGLVARRLDESKYLGT